MHLDYRKLVIQSKAVSIYSVIAVGGLGFTETPLASFS